MTYDPGYGGQPGGQPVQQYDSFSPSYAAPPEPHPGQPHPGQPHPGQPYPGQPYPGPVPAYPGAAGPNRPGPRPQTVTIAVVLTFVGIGLAFTAILMGYLAVSDMQARTSDNPLVDDGGYANSNMSNLASMVVGIAGNLMAAAGAGICAIFTLRASNGARIALAVLCGLFAVWKLACGGMGLLSVKLVSDLGVPGYRSGFGYAAAGLDMVLMLLAIAIVGLLLIGPANQYFTRPAPPAYQPYR